MVTSHTGSLQQRSGYLPERGSNINMSRPIPGRVRVREYMPPHLRDAMYATRLANAEWTRSGGSGMRYVIVCNVHEGIDPDQPIRILDAVEAEHRRQLGESPADCDYVYVTDLLQRLPEDLRKRVLLS